MIDLHEHVKQALTLMNLSNIPRWTKVQMLRPQTVGEHSFNVWVLACSLHDYVFHTPHNSFDRRAMEEWALTHDADETFTGDLPSDVKAVLNRLHPGITGMLKEEVLRVSLPKLASKVRGMKDSLPYVFVDIVDKVEAIRYNLTYNMSETHKNEVHAFLVARLKDIFGFGMQRNPGVDWRKVSGWVQALVPTVSLIG